MKKLVQKFLRFFLRTSQRSKSLRDSLISNRSELRCCRDLPLAGVFPRLLAHGGMCKYAKAPGDTRVFLWCKAALPPDHFQRGAAAPTISLSPRALVFCIDCYPSECKRAQSVFAPLSLAHACKFESFSERLSFPSVKSGNSLWPQVFLSIASKTLPFSDSEL